MHHYGNYEAQTVGKAFEEVAERSDILAKFMRETTWTYDIATRVLSRGGNLDETYSNESILEGQFNESQLGEFLHPDDVERFRQALKRREEELGGHRGVYRMKDNHGEYRHMEVASVSVGDGVSDKPVKVYGSLVCWIMHWQILRKQRSRQHRTTRNSVRN